ncbi:phosphatase PAP2 family protein [Eupransor demetentiae]|uniref:Membrane-associated phospholipid phosphatase (PgpB) n=1 Tax=Eupransor demetentiae TaxID=3109584 RepID=A0ABP0EUA2_9LACO|nr:Membrane-associated phospholipid phosphatase (PgpB) [Lactobacillaceae bacterium LMG 33000]
MIIAVMPQQKRRAILAIIAAVILAVLVGTNFAFPSQIDETVRQFWAGVQTPYGDIVMAIATFLGAPAMDIIYVFLLAVVLFFADLKIPALWTLLTLGFGDIATSIIKAVVHRERPLGHLLTDNGPSFPSQHVFGFFVVVFIMFILVTPNINSAVTRIIVKWLLLTIGGMLMLSRMYLSAHFLTDTIGGFLFAYAWVIMCAGLYPGYARYLKKNFKLFARDEI